MPNFCKKRPEDSKNRLKPPACGGFQQQKSCSHTPKIHNPDISPADGKAVTDPYPDGNQGENKIYEVPVLSSGRPEKAVEDSKGTSQQ